MRSIMKWIPPRMLARAQACVLAGLLAACAEAPAPEEPEPPEITDVFEVRVLRAAGTAGTVSHLLVRSRGDDSRFEWTVAHGDRILKRLSHEELRGRSNVRAAEDRAQILWTLPPTANGKVQVCTVLGLQGELSHCVDLDLPADTAVHALEPDDEGDAVLLARSPQGWHSAWMRADFNPQQRLADLPAEITDPVLLHGAFGAYALWQQGDMVHVWSLDEAQGRWNAWFSVPGVAAHRWVTARRPGRDAAGWLVACTAQGALAYRIDGFRQRTISSLAQVDCTGSGPQPLMAASDNGDALLLWTRPDGTLHDSRLVAADGRWTAPAAIGGLQGPPRALAADESGRFAFVTVGDDRIVRLHIYRPDVDWQLPIELGLGAHIGNTANTLGLAAGYDHASVAWVAPAPVEKGTRLATAHVDMASDVVAVRVQVQGEGSITSTPPGIACPDDCRLDASVGSTLTLRAVPGSGQRFVGWTGGCAGHGATAELTVHGVLDCGAVFQADVQPVQLALAVQGDGRASAEPPGPRYAPGTVVTLTATPGAGQRFVGWEGDADCADGQLTMQADRGCTARFEADPALAALTLQTSGGGRVLSTPAGLVCPGQCVAYFRLGSSVVLTAEPPAGTRIVWGGGCGATQGGSATLVLAAAATCGVAFEPPPAQGWQAVGGGVVPGSGDIVGRPAIAADAQGQATIAYSVQRAEFRELYVLRQAGAGWQRVGPGMLNDPLVGAFAPSLALDAQGRPVVAFGDARGRVQVRHWDGAQWRHLADDLSVAAGAVTSAPQLAMDGPRVVVAFNEFQGARVRLALMASDLATPNWRGGYADGVQLNADAELRLALDASGLAAIAYVTRSGGVAGEAAPRVVRQTAAGWVPLCDGGAGTDPGVAYANTQIGFGLQWAADGAAVLVRTRSDFRGLQAWRCNGSGAWQTHGAADGLVAAVDNSLTFLKGMAMAASGPPLVAVQVGLGYTVGSELQAYQWGPGGFALVGVPYAVPYRGVQPVLAVASAGPGSPVAAYGVEAVAGRSEVHAARFHP